MNFSMLLSASPVDAALVGGALVSFESQVSAQDRQDIQDCLAYAELAANNKYQGDTSTSAWFDYYQQTLLKAGFKLRTIVDGTPLNFASMDELADAAFTVIGDVGSAQMSQLARQAFKALRVDDVAWAYFRGHVVESSLSNFKFAPCERLASGEIAVCLFGLRYKTLVVEDEFFLGSSTNYLSLIPNGGLFEFDREAFAPLREGVHRKIDQYSALNITEG